MSQRHTHVFQADRAHEARYTPMPTMREDILAAWWNNGTITQFKNLSALKLALYMLQYGEPCRGGWMTITLTDAQVRVAAGLGKRAPYKALQHLRSIGIVVEVEAIKAALTVPDT